MLYLIVKVDNKDSEVKGHIEEDEVDKLLSEKDGKVTRARDPQMWVSASWKPEIWLLDRWFW